MNKQFEYITSIVSDRGKRIHAQISIDIKNGTVTPITSVFGSGYTGDYPVKTAANSKSIEADAVKLSEDSITVVEFKTGKFNIAAAKRQAIRYAFGIHRVSPRASVTITVIGIDADKVVSETMTSDEMIDAYNSRNANRVAVDKANNPSTISVNGRVMGESIGIKTSMVTSIIRATDSVRHQAIFKGMSPPAIIIISGRQHYAFTRDHIFNMIMYFGVFSDTRNEIAKAAVVEVAANGIDAFISAHF